MEKEIKIPKALHELHGEYARLSPILFVYFTGLIVTAIFLFAFMKENLLWWQYILLGLVIMDIAGGVVANLSTSTNQYRRFCLRTF